MRYPRLPRWAVRTGLCCLAAAMVTAVTVDAVGTSGAAQAASTPPPCAQPQQQPTPGPTTVTTIGQAYYCVYAHYYGGPVLDDRVLLAGAFAGLVQELNRLGTDQPDATMPALTGNHDGDWAAFAAVYSRLIAKVPAADVQRVAAAAMTGMITALNDNHARWQGHPAQPPGAGPDDIYGLGINTSPAPGVAQYSTAKTLPPAVVASVDPGSPAAGAGVRTGEVITAVDGAPPFTDGHLNPGAFYLLYQSYPQRQAVRIKLSWPVTGATRTVTLAPASYPVPDQPVTATLLDGDIGYLRVPGFEEGSADQVLAAVEDLKKKASLRGLILDLGGGGGVGVEVQRLLGAFEHGTAYEYDCTVDGKCTADYPDASTPLLKLPLAVVANSNCVSGCEVFTGAVKDLRLGTLIGTRSAGIIAGGALPWLLDDGSVLGLPPKHGLGADHELINGIGVAPDYYVPVTATDLATGKNPGVAKALELLDA